MDVVTISIVAEIRDQDTLEDLIQLIELQTAYIADNVIVTSHIHS